MNLITLDLLIMSAYTEHLAACLSSVFGLSWKRPSMYATIAIWPQIECDYVHSDNAGYQAV